MHPTDLLIKLVKANDLHGLQAVCRDLKEVSLQCKGYALFDYAADINRLLDVAINENASVEMLMQIYLSGATPDAGATALLKALELKKDAHAEALIAAGVRISVEMQTSSGYSNLDARQRALLAAYSAWHNAIAVVKAPSITQWLLTKSHLKIIQTELQKCATAAPDVFGEYINRITQRRESNPFLLWQWDYLVTAINELRQDCEKIDGAAFKNYHHPEAIKAFAIDPKDKDAIEEKAEEIMSPLIAAVKDNEQIKKELIWYVSTPEITVDDAEKIARVKTLLASQRSLFDFYSQNPEKLLKAKNTATPIDKNKVLIYFREMCVHLINPNVKNIQVVNPRVGLPGFLEAIDARLPVFIHQTIGSYYSYNMYVVRNMEVANAMTFLSMFARVLAVLANKPNLKEINLYELVNKNFPITTALHEAIKANSVQLVRLCLSLLPGADDFIIADVYSMGHRLASAQSPQVAELLLMHPSTQNVNFSFEPAFVSAIDQNRPAVFAALLKHPNSLYSLNVEILNRTLTKGNILILGMLFNKPGFNINEREMRFSPSMHIAIDNYWDERAVRKQIEDLISAYHAKPKITTLNQLIEKLFCKDVINTIRKTNSLNQFRITFPLQFPEAVVNLVQLNCQMTNKWFFQKDANFKLMFEEIAKHAPEVLIEFAKCVVENRKENPFNSAEWETWSGLFSSALPGKLTEELKKYHHPNNLQKFGASLQMFSTSTNSTVVPPLSTEADSELAEAIKKDLDTKFNNTKLSHQDCNALLSLFQTSSPETETEFQEQQALQMQGRIVLNQHGSQLETIVISAKKVAPEQRFLAKRTFYTCLQQELETRFIAPPHPPVKELVAPPAALSEIDLGAMPVAPKNRPEDDSDPEPVLSGRTLSAVAE